MSTYSKRLSFWLRHWPLVPLDDQGWAQVEELLKKAGPEWTFKLLEEIVNTDDKQRYSFNEDKTKIRANQGHSLKNVKIDFKVVKPPFYLYHGTSEQFLLSIKKQGLTPQKRQYVHLSESFATASQVGARRSNPVVLRINANLMYFDGIKFFQSDNGVFLVSHVKPEYIIF